MTSLSNLRAQGFKRADKVEVKMFLTPGGFITKFNDGVAINDSKFKKILTLVQSMGRQIGSRYSAAASALL